MVCIYTRQIQFNSITGGLKGLKAKEVKRVLALSMAITLAAPVNALAAGPESGLDEGQIIEGQELSEGGTPEGETPEGETPEGETPGVRC